MNSSAIEAPIPVKNPRRCWSSLQGLSLITPVLAVVWMAFISKLTRPTLSMNSPHFRAFWLWNAIALVSVAWGIGLLARLLRPQQPEQEVQFKRGTLGVALAVAVVVAVYAGLFEISRFIILSATPLLVAVAFYVGSWPMSGQRKAVQPLTVLVSAFLAAAIWKGLQFDGQSAVGTVARGWLAMGCAAGVWLALQDPLMDRPQLHLAQEVMAGYLFAAGVSLAPGIWGGEVPEVFAGDQTLLLAVVVGLNRWIRRFATLPAGIEYKLLSKLIPITLCAGLAMLYPLWHHLLPVSNLTDRRMIFVLGLSLTGMLLTCGFLKRLTSTQLDIALALCLCTPVLLLCWPAAWVVVPG